MSLELRLLQSPEFQAFTDQVAAAVSKIDPVQPDAVQSLKDEREHLESECNGYLMSLGKQTLLGELRAAIESKYQKSLTRIQAIDDELEDIGRLAETKQSAVRPEDVAKGLANLADILDGQNVPAMNLMLAQHIDRIDCFPDGSVSVRTCLLGAMAGAKELLAEYGHQNPGPTDGGSDRIQPRRLSRRDVGIGIEDEEEAEAANNFAADPGRFGDLGPEWFSIDQFQEPRYHSWASSNATLVAEYRLATRSSEEAVAKHFGKSIPTIRSALRIAKREYGIDATGKAITNRSTRTWPELNAQAVADFLKEPGRLLKDAVIYFNKSEPTIRKSASTARLSSS